MKILVIEDHPAELKLVHHVLTAAGNSVNSVEAAEKAFESIRKDKPQVILLDMSLPGMDGLALVRRIKGDTDTRDIYVVGITSFPEKYSKTASLAAGCDAFISKPLNTRTLSGDLSKLLESA